MPRKKGPAPKAVSNGPNWYGFVRCDFSAESKQQFDVFYEEISIDAAWAWFLASVDTFKITFAWYDAQSCYQVSMTGTDPDQPMYFGWTLTARGRDVERTLCALMFKHENILKQEWNHQVIEKERPNDWVG